MLSADVSGDAYGNQENLKLAKISFKNYTPAMLSLHPALMNRLRSGTEIRTKKLIYNSNWVGFYRLAHYFTQKMRESLVQHQRVIINLEVDVEEDSNGHAMFAI